MNELVKSPCINVCTMDEETGYCQGCFRTLTEIAAWPAMGEEEKRRVIALLEKRRDGV